MAAETFRITEELVVEDRTGSGLESARRKVSQFDKTLQETQSRLNKMTGSKWSVAFNAVDKATSVITKVESKIKSAAGKAWNFTVGVIDKATAPIQGIFNLLKNPILQAGAVLGISVSASDAINTFSGFEATMSKVKAISGASGEDFENLTALAKEMGATTKFTAQEAAEGLTYMAMAGWKTEDMLTSLSGVMNLAAASGEDLATVSDIVTDAMTAFGMSASGYTEAGVANATHFADVLAVASSNANTNVAMMGETFKYVGAASGSLGYSIEDVALGIGLMANSGIKASQAGTELNSIFTRLSTNTNGTRDAIEEMGISFYTSTGDARDFADVLGDLRAATQGMTKEQKMNFANTVAGQRAQAGLLAMLNATEEDYRKLTDAIVDCDGAAEAMAGTMLDNLQGSMTLLSSAVDGVKMSLGSRLSPYLRQFVDWLTTKMPDVEAVINRVMDTVDEKVAQLKGTIAEFTSSDEWANADIWGKIAIAWDKIVAEPFSQWWESSGKPWLTEKVAAFGETLGSGITAGLLALLGFDASGAVADGVTIGKSFFEGFKSGLDMDKISEAFTEWASDHKGIVAAAGVVAGGKLLGGIAKAFQTGKSLFGGLSGGGGSGGGGGLGSFVTTMTVSAGTVIVNGSMSSGAANAVRNVAQGATGTGGTLALPGAAGAAGNAGRLALPGASEAGRLALPGPAGGAAATGGLTSAGSWLSKLLTMGSSSSVVGADGTLLAVQGGVGGTLGSVGGALGSGATTAAGAAAAGTAAIGGGLLGGAGIISGLIDIFKGTQSTGKEAQDKYATGGTKIGMVGAGAAAGAAIGSVVPVVGTGVGALVGAGVGGLGALLGGDGIGKMLSDALDEGGALNNLWQSIKTGASGAWESVKEGASTIGSAVAEKWDSLKEGAAAFGEFASGKLGAARDAITEKWNSLSSWFGDNVWTPISDLGISAINIAAGAWISIAEPIQEKWGELTGWFSENVWEPVKEKAQEAGQWISDRWTEAKDWVSETWSSFCGWFDENVYGPVKEGAQAAATWIGERWNDAKAAVSEAWQAFSGWFDETVWSPMKEGARAAGEWIGTKWTEAKTLVSESWQAFSGWFDETVWSPVKEGARAAGEWIGSKISEAKDAITTAWEGVSGWFSENVWSPIKEGAQAAGEWIGEKMAAAKNAIQGAWESAKDFVAGLGDKGSQATGLTTSQGQSTVLAHASGGIMTQPHMGLVAEDGPEAIIPLGASSRSRGMAVWEEAGDILGANGRPSVGSNDNGTDIDTRQPVGSNDSGPTANAPAPTGSNDNGLGDIIQEANAGGHSGQQDGGNDKDVPVYTSETPGRTGPAEASQDAPVNVPVNITINPEVIIQAAQGGMSADDIIALLKEHIRAMVDDISDEMAEKLARIFANMPVRGGA